jgi:hypothetical protein
MSRVEEIEAAIESLPPEDFQKIANWCREREHAIWDDQMDADSANGRLDFLFEEAKNDSLQEWPPIK